MINKQHNIKIAVAEVEAGDAAGVVEETEEDVGVAGMVVEEEEMVEAEMEEDATEGVEGAEDEEEALPQTRSSPMGEAEDHLWGVGVVVVVGETMGMM